MTSIARLTGALLIMFGAPTAAAAASAPTWVAPLPRPLTVVRAFDPPAQRWLSGHRGVDLAGPDGALVRAAGAGRVSFAGQLAGRGLVVVVHGALRTTYEPLRPSVHVGDAVAAGDAIGSLQPGHQAGRPTASILHWGLLRGETYVDPLSLLSIAKPVRLLPHWRAGTLSASRGFRPGPLALPSATRHPQRTRPRPIRAALAAAGVVLAAAAAVSRRPP